MNKIKLFVLFALLLFVASMTNVAMAQCNIVAVPDASVVYQPTQIANGDFSVAPSMEGSGYSRIPNGTNQGWNTTEVGDQCFEYLCDNPCGHAPGLDNHCSVEMNADNEATLYQDLFTNGGDVIRWSLQHAVRYVAWEVTNPKMQAIRVEVGAPNYDESNIVYPHGIGGSINTEINAETKVTYQKDDLSNPSPHIYGYVGQMSDLDGLCLDRDNDRDEWYTATGVYAIPNGQDVTRFAFVSYGAQPGECESCGNLLDNISFSTLIGDVTATYGAGNSVIISGYWGDDDDSKKLVVEVGGETFYVDMSGVSGQNFTVTIPYSYIGTSFTTVTFYHQDYPSAARTIDVNIPMVASATGVETDFDGNAYHITVTVTEPTDGYSILYGHSAQEINLTENPTFSNVGNHPVYYMITKSGYTTVKGVAYVNILPVMYDVTVVPNYSAMGSILMNSTVFASDFNSASSLPDGWTTIGPAWSVSGGCLKSGAEDDQTSSLNATVTITGSGSISFNYRISSEGCCDRGRFYIDGSEKINVSGEGSWQSVLYDLSAGTHTLSWRYSKDESYGAGEDGFFIDDITITSIVTVGSSPMSIENGTTVDLIASPNTGYAFVNWTDAGDNVIGTNTTLAYTVTGNATITANFEQLWLFSFKSDTEDLAKWSADPDYAASGQSVTATYTGSKTVERVVARRKYANIIDLNSSNAATAQDDFNGTADSKIVASENFNANLVFTRSEGEIDLNGHSNGGWFNVRNDVAGQSITIRNGSFLDIDGIGGWGTCYKGTVILENINCRHIYTDGMDYVFRGGTYQNIHNYKNNSSPGTVTIYSGKFNEFNTDGHNPNGTLDGTYTLYGGMYKFNPATVANCTVIIPDGYSVQLNPDINNRDYPWAVVKTSNPYEAPSELGFDLNKVSANQWSFTMPAYNVEVEVTYASHTVEMAASTPDAEHWTITPSLAAAGATITLDYDGEMKVDAVSLVKKGAMLTNAENVSAMFTAFNNATNNPQMVLTGDIPCMGSVTISQEEGTVDLNGHNICSNFFIQNNTRNKALTLRNGHIQGELDGAGGCSNAYVGTVYLENLVIESNLWCDGHEFYIYNTTINGELQNIDFTPWGYPSKVTIFSGKFNVLRHACGSIDGRGQYVVYGGKFGENYADWNICAPGYSFQANTDEDAATYPWVVKPTSKDDPAKSTESLQWALTMPAYDVEAIVEYGLHGQGTVENPYTISSLDEWNTFASKVNSGEDFAGKFVLQTADITGVTKMAGITVGSTNCRFSGTYDGGNHTMTLAINSTAEHAAPFALITGATIKNLHTAGTINTSNSFAGSIVGEALGNSKIINCLSTVTLTSSKSGDCTHGGLVGVSNGTTIEGCVFNGSLLTTNNTINCGGLVGWSQTDNPKTIITDCLFDPVDFTPSMATNWSATVGRDGGNSGSNYTITNTYYTQAFGHVQAKEVHSISAGDGVTVANAGEETVYGVSGITSYGTGILYGGVLYAGNGDAVSLNLTHADAPTGYSFYDYIADHGTLTGSSNPYSLTMADANATINVRYSASISITGTTTNAKDGWYLISSPIGAVSPSSVNNMTSNDYDIFRFNQNPTLTGSQYLEWENWKLSGSHYHFDLEPGRGYLYANSSNVTLTFIGTPYDGNGQVTLVRSKSNGNTDGDMLGWNLIGNPLGVTATIGDKPFYRINDNHTGIIVREDNNISPMEGIFVYAESDGEIVTFSSTPSIAKGGERNENSIVINLSDNKGTIIDRAIVSFEKGHTLPKFQIRENSTKFYIPQNGVDYAIAFSYRIGELPLNFKAEETGVYTLSFSGENMNGVSLVDMIDNAVIDLSVNDTYTFIGSPNDRENRFKLVFSSINDSNIDIFAYQSGNDIVVSGEGELQVFDVMGRMVMQQRIDGVQTVEKPSTTGIFIFRLNEKSQKIVVR